MVSRVGLILVCILKPKQWKVKDEVMTTGMTEMTAVD